MDASISGFAETIRGAAEAKRPLRLRGGGTKDFYGGPCAGEILDTRTCAGIVNYEPSELVITARCGTPLADVERVLSEHGQMLAFEPPHFGAGATLGGCVAAGLSGPRRAAGGAVRDFVLGARIVDGRGRTLGFGGRVMKNVAGYDISRLLAGSLGTLGVITEISLKVLPQPQSELTLRFEMPEQRAIDAMNRWAGMALPLSATAWTDGMLSVRLSGAQSALRAAVASLGGERVDGAQADPFWRGIREQTDPFFAGEAPLWRLSLPAATPRLSLPAVPLIEWNGWLRWLKVAAEPAAVRAVAAAAGGHATLFRAPDKSAGAFAALPPVLARVHRELKAAFDPAGILNRGRLYAEF